MKKIATVIIMVAVLCCAFFVIHHFFIGNWSSDNINRYVEATERQAALPELEELGAYSDIEFKYYRKNMLLFFSNAYTLKISYNNENYQKEKSNFLQNYIYEAGILEDYGGYKKEANFVMDTYSFKILSFEKYETQGYPHEIVFVGFSDEKNEIAIVCYFNSDLDYIDVSFPKFLEEECGWE